MAKKAKREHLRKSKKAKDVSAPKKPNGFCYWDNDVLVLNVLGTPSAKSDKIGKAKGNQLKISVKAIPKTGRATDYLVDFLSNKFGVKTSDIEVVFGRMNPNKQLRIKSPKHLPAVIEKFLNKKNSKL